ncbi:MAG: acyl-CoA dehydrogenase family protein [Pseudomonadota bacterium]
MPGSCLQEAALRVTETAIQVYCGYRYCSQYPVGQFMRHVKIASLYEGVKGHQARRSIHD